MIGIIVVLCALLITAGLYIRYQGNRIDSALAAQALAEKAAARAQEARARSEKALASLRKLNAAEARRRVLEANRVTKALAAEPEWAEQAVPKAVIEAINESSPAGAVVPARRDGVRERTAP